MLRQTSRKIGKTLTNKAEISETPLFNMILQNPTKLIIITCTYLYIVYTIYMVFWCLLTSPIFSLYQVGLTGLRGCVFHATCMCMVGTVLNASSNLHHKPQHQHWRFAKFVFLFLDSVIHDNFMTIQFLFWGSRGGKPPRTPATCMLRMRLKLRHLGFVVTA